MDGRGPLKGHAYAESGPFVGGHLGDIDALEDNLARSHGVPAKAHECHEQRGFSGTVGTEENERLSFIDIQVDPFQDFPVTDIDMQVFNLKHMVSLWYERLAGATKQESALN
jgi:hypothetical protein